MELHHNRHLQTYVDNLNRILKNYPEYHTLSLEGLLFYLDSLPEELQTPVKNNAGGVYNHIFFLFQYEKSGNTNTGTSLHFLYHIFGILSRVFYIFLMGRKH